MGVQIVLMLMAPRVYGDDIGIVLSFPRAFFSFPRPSLVCSRAFSSHSRAGGNPELHILLNPRVYGDDIKRNGNDKEGDGDNKKG
jgi:hypothetical protein